MFAFFSQKNPEGFAVQAVIPVAILTTFKLRKLFISAHSDKPIILPCNKIWIFHGRNPLASQQVGKEAYSVLRWMYFLVLKAGGQQEHLYNVTRMMCMPAKVQGPSPLEVQTGLWASFTHPTVPSSTMPSHSQQKGFSATSGEVWETMADCVCFYSLPFPLGQVPHLIAKTSPQGYI